jgi:seipin
MPESPQNEQIGKLLKTIPNQVILLLFTGMFMINLTLFSHARINIGTSIRPATLHYKSSLLHTFSTFFYALPLVLGLTEQRQSVTVTMIEDYQESYFTDGSIYARVTILSHNIQLYSTRLTFDAKFTGFAYYLYNWPISMAVIVTTGIFFSVTVMTIFLWARRIMDRFHYRRRQFFNHHRRNIRPPELDPIPEEIEEPIAPLVQHIEEIPNSSGTLYLVHNVSTINDKILIVLMNIFHRA